MSNFSYPITEAWGGLLACTSPDDCVEPGTGRNIYAVNCVPKARLINAVEELAADKYCVCTYQRHGPMCLSTYDPIAIFVPFTSAAVMFPSFYYAIILLRYLLRKRGTYNQAYFCVLQSFLCLFGTICWTAGRWGIASSHVTATLGASRAVNDFLGIPFTSSLGIRAVLTVSTAWYETLNSLNASHKGATIRKVGNVMFGLLVVAICVLSYLKNWTVAAFLVVLYAVVIGIWYTYMGCTLKSAFAFSSSKPSSKSNKVRMRIQRSLRRVSVACFSFALSAVGGAAANYVPVDLQNLSPEYLNPIASSLIHVAAANLAVSASAYALETDQKGKIVSRVSGINTTKLPTNAKDSALVTDFNVSEAQ